MSIFRKDNLKSHFNLPTEDQWFVKYKKETGLSDTPPVSQADPPAYTGKINTKKTYLKGKNLHQFIEGEPEQNKTISSYTYTSEYKEEKLRSLLERPDQNKTKCLLVSLGEENIKTKLNLLKESIKRYNDCLIATEFCAHPENPESIAEEISHVNNTTLSTFAGVYLHKEVLSPESWNLILKAISAGNNPPGKPIPWGLTAKTDSCEASLTGMFGMLMDLADVLTSTGKKPADVLRSLRVRLILSDDFIRNISGIYAVKLIWKIISDGYEIKETPYLNLQVQIAPGKNHEDGNEDLIAYSAQVTAALSAGVTSFITPPLNVSDETGSIAYPDNIFKLLKEESGITPGINHLRGSYLPEEEAVRLAEKIVSNLQELEHKGGYKNQ